jgi:hypothetical protein
MMKLKAIDELDSATVQGRTMVNKSSQNQKGEKKEVCNNSRGEEFTRWLWCEVETTVVEKTVVVETEEDINIFFLQL